MAGWIMDSASENKCCGSKVLDDIHITSAPFSHKTLTIRQTSGKIEHGRPRAK